MPHEWPRRKYWKLAGISAASLGVAAAILIFFENAGPFYKGRSLHSWLAPLGSDGGTLPEVQASEAVVKALGKKAIPSLRAMLRPYGRNREKISQDYRNWKWVNIWMPERNERVVRALAALEMLGREGEPAVPELTALVQNGIPEAARTLSRIGTPIAVSNLTQLIRSTHENARHAALYGVSSNLFPNSDLQKALVACCTDSSSQVRKEALSKLICCPLTDEVCSLLVSELTDPDRPVSGQAGWTLGSFGHHARSAVPKLVELVSRDQSGPAASALGRIDPAAAVLAGVKFWRDPDMRHPTARADLEKLKDHPDPKVRALVDRLIRSYDDRQR